MDVQVLLDRMGKAMHASRPEAGHEAFSHDKFHKEFQAVQRQPASEPRSSRASAPHDEPRSRIRSKDIADRKDKVKPDEQEDEGKAKAAHPTGELVAQIAQAAQVTQVVQPSPDQASLPEQDLAIQGEAEPGTGLPPQPVPTDQADPTLQIQAQAKAALNAQVQAVQSDSQAQDQQPPESLAHLLSEVKPVNPSVTNPGDHVTAGKAAAKDSVLQQDVLMMGKGDGGAVVMQTTHADSTQGRSDGDHDGFDRDRASSPAQALPQSQASQGFDRFINHLEGVSHERGQGLGAKEGPAGVAATPLPAEPEMNPTGATAVHFDIEPPELGRVRLRVALSDRTVYANVTTEQPGVRDLLMKQASSLETSLNSSGFSMGGFQVDLGQNGQQAGQQQFNSQVQRDGAWHPSTPSDVSVVPAAAGAASASLSRTSNQGLSVFA